MARSSRRAAVLSVGWMLATCLHGAGAGWTWGSLFSGAGGGVDEGAISSTDQDYADADGEYVALDMGQGAECSVGDPTCGVAGRASGQKRYIRRARQGGYTGQLGTLLPSDLPPPTVFDTWRPSADWAEEQGGGGNGTVELPGYDRAGYEQAVAHGSVPQQGTGASVSRFAVLPAVMKPAEADQLLNLLRHSDTDGEPVALDADPDTVDGMPTREIFIDSIDLRRGLPAKGEDPTSQERMHGREPLRLKLKAITDKVLEERITPFVRQQYPELCSAGDGRACTPCFSLVRKYQQGMRNSHGTHHDGHALVTVVVSLSDYGTDYAGGLFVGANNSQRQFLALRKGDAVVHQSDLLHGVKVTGVHNEDTGITKMERWSWILWFRDSEKCEDFGYEWFADCAERGNPTCEMLHATKMGTAPGLAPDEASEQVLLWNTRAAQKGHGAAGVKVARAHLKLLPSSLPYSAMEARQFFEAAIESSNEPDAHYGLAQMQLTKKATGPTLRTALGHLEAAARGAHVFAMFNLGIAHLFGYGTARDPDAAGAWFEASGLPEGFFIKAMHSRAAGAEAEAVAFEDLAKSFGFGTPWRRIAREKTGSGGAAGVSLNLEWPPDAGGNVPAQF